MSLTQGDSATCQLQEPVGLKYDPRPEDLDTRLLRIKLGKNFDPELMSIRKPYDLLTNRNGSVKFPFKRNRNGRLVPLGDVSWLRTNYMRILIEGMRIW